MDLRSEEEEKRTLHFFVRGKQQESFFKGLPEEVEFCVLSFISFLLDLSFFFVIHLYSGRHILSE